MIATKPTRASIHVSDLRWRRETVAWRTDEPDKVQLGTGHVAYSAGETYGPLSIIPMCDSGERTTAGIVLLAPRDETPLLPARCYAIVHGPTRVTLALAVSGAAARRWVESAVAAIGGGWHVPSEHRAEINDLIDRGRADGLLMRDGE